MYTLRRHNPLLFELLINLLFFSFCACVIICVFASAFRQSEDNKLKQQAITYAQYIAEEYRSADIDTDNFFKNHGWTTQSSYSAYEMNSDGFMFKAYYLNDIPGISGFRLLAENCGNEVFAFNVKVYRDDE